MKITGVDIDGFGEYAKFSLTAFDSPVTVLYGPNETRKSTLLAFIRTVLYGFPMQRYAKYFPPLAGGNHGGRIELATKAGKHFTVGRHQGPKGGPVSITGTDGTSSHDTNLLGFLRDTPAPTFRTVFTFNLKDLQQLDLKSEDHRISLGASAVQISQALKQLKKRAEDIYKPSGTKQRISKVLSKLKQVEGELQEVESHSQDYGRARSRLDELEEKATELNEKMTIESAKVKEFERRLQSWDEWVGLVNVDEKLATIEKRAGFPHNALVRLDGLEEQQSTATEKVDTARNKLERAQKEARRPVPGALLLDQISVVGQIRGGHDSFDRRISTLPTIESELNAEEAKLNTALKNLGREWNEERLQTFDISIPRRDEVEHWKSCLSSASEDLRSSTRDADVAKQELDEVNQRIQDDHDPTGNSPSRQIIGPVVLGILGVILLILGVAGSRDLEVLLAGAALIVTAVLMHTLMPRPTPTDALGEIQRTAERLRKRTEAAAQRRDKQQETLDEVTAKWFAWLNRQKLPGTCTPDTVYKIFNQIENARKDADSVREKRTRITQIKAHIETFRSAVTPLATNYLGPNYLVDDSLMAVSRTASHLVDLFDQAQEETRTRDEAKRSAADRDDDLKQAIREQTRVTERIHSLLAEAQTDDAEDFRRQARQYLERQDLDRKYENHVSALRAAWGNEHDLNTLRSAFGAMTKDETDDALRNAKLTLAKLTALNEARNIEQGTLEERLRTLSGDKVASQLRGRREELHEELHTLALDWSTVTLARSLVEKACKKYEEERQPDVIRRAEQFFHALTGSRYSKLRTEVEEQKIGVFDTTTGRWKNPEHLSTSTYEQLYLALRFGLIQSMGKETEPMPVIADDILVNFDIERAGYAARAFVELSRTNQVLILTCHQWMVDLFTEAAPTTKVIDLSAPHTAPQLTVRSH